MQIPGLRMDGGLEGLPWKSTRYEGVDWVDLAGPPAVSGGQEGSMTVLIRMAPGRGYPGHRHLGPEDVLVLAGAYRDDGGRILRAGTFHRYPAGSCHEPVALGDPDRDAAPGNEACVLFAVAHGGTELLESR